MVSAHLQQHTYTWQWQNHTLNIATETLGSGPSVLLLPAFSTVSTRAELTTLAQALASHFQVTLLDWPGFGDSDRPAVPYQPEFYRQFLRAFVQDTLPQEVAVVAAGHAAGYALSLQSWSRMVLIAPTWRGPLAVMGVPVAMRRGIRQLVSAPVIGSALYGLNTRPGFLKWMYRRHVFVDETQLAPEFMAQRYQNTQQLGARYAPAAFVTGGLDPVDERQEFLASLAQQTEPVMVIVAEQAPPGSKAEMEAMVKLPNIQAAYVPGSLGMAEEFGDVIAPMILPFLQGSTTPI
ncbi:alpha/beta fold hydrolase [Acaryochloris sp. IP29b_bin.137]|uniref:alpha/beta fold hydrolase n=1 Tax=Acaryochloris sp. IP29b_bin.137 TaxID=2969217 RepID=UPI00262D6EF8|nr:alpha/beta fold hydrolase [Acaryochloris sp. IP29b_bin.137]